MRPFERQRGSYAKLIIHTAFVCCFYENIVLKPSTNIPIYMVATILLWINKHTLYNDAISW